MTKYLKAVFWLLVGTAIGISLPLLAKHLPADHDDAFSWLGTAVVLFVQVATPIVVAIALGVGVWRYIERTRRNKTDPTRWEKRKLND